MMLGAKHDIEAQTTGNRNSGVKISFKRIYSFVNKGSCSV